MEHRASVLLMAVGCCAGGSCEGGGGMVAPVASVIFVDFWGLPAVRGSIDIYVQCRPTLSLTRFIRICVLIEDEEGENL